MIAFGEILYDVFENEKALGGAPFNFCAHYAKLGGYSRIVSAVGRDELGSDALIQAKKYGIDTSLIEKSGYPTGTCIVSIDADGQPTYDITQNSAFDYIDFSRSFASELFYFGTLAQRNEVSAKCLRNILEHGRFSNVYFDVNLRQNYYSKEMLEFGISHSTILKLNNDELRILDEMGIHPEKYHLKIIIITLGADGAQVLTDNKSYSCVGNKVKAVSAVGAGDGFSACFIYNYISGGKIGQCLEKACRLGEYIVGFNTAIPEYNPKDFTIR